MIGVSARVYEQMLSQMLLETNFTEIRRKRSNDFCIPISIKYYNLYINLEQIMQYLIQMSEVDNESKKPKSKEDYSRNVKKLKIKLTKVQNEIITLEQRIESITNTSNDKIISMKIAKFCKERRFTPEMLFRFADRRSTKTVSKMQFQETLTQLGLKLSKDQFMRMEYLIDEDLSGSISFAEYNGYLDSFGIKKQFSAGDIAVRDVFNKLDIDKILKQTEQNNIPDKTKKKHRNLLNYQQFIKYCHKEFPSLHTKELATIFNRLERNQLIDLEDLLNYLKNQAAEKKKLQEKNKRLVKKKDSININLGKEKSLKIIIQALLKYRIKGSTILFLSSEFNRLEKLLNCKRGEILSLFKEIDKKRRGPPKGSFTHNQLINYYIEKLQNNPDIIFAFELMGHKLSLLNQIPESVVGQYSQQGKILTQPQMKKCLENEFQVRDREYISIAKQIPRLPNGNILVQTLAQLLKYQNGKKTMYIKPTIITNKLVFKSGLQALRCCLQLESKMEQVKQTQWNDYQFGPTENDQFGIESINLPMPSQQVEWFRVSELGMNQFYNEKMDTTYHCSHTCPHETFAKTLYSLVSLKRGIVWSKDALESNAKDIEQPQLSPLFKGLYPLAFHYFAKYGIYVIKLFVNEKWKFVVIDNKIPCSADKTPFFSSVQNMRYSFMSLIQKAYAKVFGNYKCIYDSNLASKYIIELANILPIENSLEKAMPQNIKNSLWNNVLKLKEYKLKKNSKQNKNENERQVYGIIRPKKDKQLSDVEITFNMPIKIQQIMEIEDKKCKNSHKSHRLIIMRLENVLSKESTWNQSWNRTDGHNKYSQTSLQIANELKDQTFLKNDNILLLNYKLFRSIFSLYRLESVDFPSMIILRKSIQFEEKFKCRYQISSKAEFEFVIVLSQVSALADSKIVIDVKDDKQAVLEHTVHREEMIVHPIRLEKGTAISLELYVDNWKSDMRYHYTLTLYMQHPRYQIKQRDRHMLFRFVSPYEQEPKMEFSQFQNDEKQFIYRNFYKAAERRGCCG